MGKFIGPREGQFRNSGIAEGHSVTVWYRRIGAKHFRFQSIRSRELNAVRAYELRDNRGDGIFLDAVHRHTFSNGPLKKAR